MPRLVGVNQFGGTPGQTFSTNFPTLSPYQGANQGSSDAFVTKLSSSGGSLVYSTYLGGGSDESTLDIAVDASGNAYLTGFTYSTNFPTQNPYQGTFQGGVFDDFVTKISSNGSTLVYSTYLGGSGEEYAHGINVDANGSVYVAGTTSSLNFPTMNPIQGSNQGGADAFVINLSSSGASLVYGTYLGGGGEDYVLAIAVDATGNAYLIGYTYSTDFPTLNPYQGTFQGDHDAFVTKLGSFGGLIYSTYLGGSNGDVGREIAVDGWGNAYVTGETVSENFPTQNPFQASIASLGGYVDVFVTKLNNVGSGLIYSTYLGGNLDEYVRGIAIDGGGNAYVTGNTISFDFPTVNPYQGTFQGIRDAFVTKIGGDSDLDGEPDGTDNCPFNYNPLQEDFDNDGQGDSCFMPNYLSPLTVVARYVAPSPPSPPNPPGDPNVNLRVIDPSGLFIGADSVGSITNTIGGSAGYFQTGGNDSIVIVDPKSGEYTIEVIPEADANVGDKYLVGIRIDGTVELVDPDKLVPNEGERDTVFVNNIPYAFGDGDGDRSVTIGDAVYIIAYIFLAGPAPVPVVSSDSDCDGTVTIGDAVHIIGYIFLGGGEPGCGP